MANKRNTHRRATGPRPIAADIDKLLRPLFRKRGFVGAEIHAQWPYIIGDRLAEVTQPERIRFPGGEKTNGTLELKVASSAWAVELQHLQPQILERINAYFGYQAISRLKLLQGPVVKRAGRETLARAELDAAEKESVEQTTAGVADAGVRERLNRLGYAVKRRRKAQKKP